MPSDNVSSASLDLPSQVITQDLSILLCATDKGKQDAHFYGEVSFERKYQIIVRLIRYRARGEGEREREARENFKLPNGIVLHEAL